MCPDGCLECDMVAVLQAEQDEREARRRRLTDANRWENERMARRKEHDRYCPQAKWSRDDHIEWWDGCQTDFDCRCDLIALVRADEQAKSLT